MAKLDLKKQVFSKIEYPSVIDTTFRDLSVTSISQDILSEDNVTKFFDMYNQLFYAIPAEGETNSHEYLALTSGEYIDFQANEEEIEALQAEITTLREQLLEQQTINLEAITGEKLDLNQEDIEEVVGSGGDNYALTDNSIQQQAADAGIVDEQGNNFFQSGQPPRGGGGIGVPSNAGQQSVIGPGGGGPAYASDRKLKINITNIGKSRSGINIYRFNYKEPKKHGYGLFEGVMAQEVPQASFKHPDGHLMVDYSKIDVSFKKLS
tara:strand:+ start:596 stop:1390 length:795 start_codon:yes stop_codon:yes gene_type:complete